MHRDLKLENIMVDIENFEGNSTLVCKVIDFGFSVAIDPSGKESLALGTPSYMAPEIVARRSYDKSVDIWALGVAVYKMLVGHPPFRSKSGVKLEVYDAILNQQLDLTPLSRFHEGGHLIKSFISKCLNKDPTKRLTASELLNDDWIQTMVEKDVVARTTEVMVGHRLD